MNIGFIGAGNMAAAIMEGILRRGLCGPQEIMVSRRSEEALGGLREKYGVQATADNGKVAEWSEVLLLAVKPQMLSGVIDGIRDRIREEALVISIAAGKTLDWLAGEIARPLRLVRAMPNTPALVGAGCTAYCGGAQASEEDLETAKRLFSCCGEAVEIPESLMDVAGAAAGSSPAYVFMFMEAMADAAVAGGMPRAMAYRMAGQAVMGSAKLLLETGEHPGVLKDRVCSPGGTTICGVKVLEEEGFRGAVMGALAACIERSGKI